MVPLGRRINTASCDEARTRRLPRSGIHSAGRVSTGPAATGHSQPWINPNGGTADTPGRIAWPGVELSANYFEPLATASAHEPGLVIHQTGRTATPLSGVIPSTGTIGSKALGPGLTAIADWSSIVYVWFCCDAFAAAENRLEGLRPIDGPCRGYSPKLWA